MVARAAPARPDAIRRHNLAMTLDQIHRDGRLTRAELTRRLGMSRSTVGGLVADLVELGFVAESVPSGNDRAGRPSHVVEPARSGPYVLAVDLDVIGVTVAAVGLAGHVMARRTTEWPQAEPTPARVARAVADLIRRLPPDVPATGAVGIGVSVPGAVDELSGVVTLAPNLDWHAEPLVDALRRRLHTTLPIRIGNDADLAVLAEHQRGSGRGIDELVYLMGRVGIGAGIMVNGRLLRGRSGRVGEIGHNPVDRRGPLCHCGRRGCFETYVGDAALLRLAGREGAPTASHVAEVFEAARGGERRALTAVRRVAAALGHGVAALVNTIDPQRIILGGSLGHVLELAEPELRDALQKHVFGAGQIVEIAAPGLGDDSALLGAAEIAYEPLLADPYSAAG